MTKKKQKVLDVLPKMEEETKEESTQKAAIEIQRIGRGFLQRNLNKLSKIVENALNKKFSSEFDKDSDKKKVTKFTIAELLRNSEKNYIKTISDLTKELETDLSNSNDIIPNLVNDLIDNRDKNDADDGVSEDSDYEKFKKALFKKREKNSNADQDDAISQSSGDTNDESLLDDEGLLDYESLLDDDKYNDKSNYHDNFFSDNDQNHPLGQQISKLGWPRKKSWIDLETQGYFADNFGATSITEICSSDEEEKQQGNFWLDKDGSFFAVFKGVAGLNRLGSQIRTANNDDTDPEKWPKYPIVSLATVIEVPENNEGNLKTVYSLAIKTQQGVTQSFVDESSFLGVKKTYREEYELALLASVCRKILEKNEDSFESYDLGGVALRKDTILKIDNFFEPIAGNLNSEEWANEKLKRNTKIIDIAKNINSQFLDQSINLNTSLSEENEIFRKFFSDPKQAEEAEEKARKFAAKSASRVNGNKVERKVAKNAAEVDLTKEEAEKIANEAFSGGNTDYKALLEQPIPDAIGVNSTSCHRPRNRNDIATVLFSGEEITNNRMFLSLNSTDKYVMAERCKSESITTKDGRISYIVNTFEDGKPKQVEFTESQIGKVIIPKNTVFTLDEKAGKYIPQKASDLSKSNKYDHEVYKNFKVKAISTVDGKRHMATLFGGEVRTTEKSPLIEKISTDREGKQIKFKDGEKGECWVKTDSINCTDAYKNSVPMFEVCSKVTADGKGGISVETPSIFFKNSQREIVEELIKLSSEGSKNSCKTKLKKAFDEIKDNKPSPVDLDSELLKLIEKFTKETAEDVSKYNWNPTKKSISFALEKDGKYSHKEIASDNSASSTSTTVPSTSFKVKNVSLLINRSNARGA